MIDISIVVPIYKIKLNYLKECLNSCINQTMKNIEIICIIDGHDAKIEEVCKKYQSRYQNIRCYTQDNQGVSSARNKGINLSKGKYICFVDADDSINSDYCNDLYEFASVNSLDYVISGYKEEYANCNKIKDIKIKQSVVKKVNKEFIITNFFRPDYAKLNLNFNSPWAKLYSKKFLDENNLYFNEKFKYGEDLLFNFAVIQSTERIGIVKKYDYNYRIRKDAITSSSLEKIIEYKNKLLKEMISLVCTYKDREHYIDNMHIYNYFSSKSVLLTTKCDIKSFGFLKKDFNNYYDLLKNVQIFNTTMKEKFIRICPFFLLYLLQKFKIKDNEKIKFD